MKILYLILKIIGGLGATFTGIYFVSVMAMENVTLKFEQRQDAKAQAREKKLMLRNDSLINNVNAAIKQSENPFTLEENAEITERIINDAVKGLKRFVKNENIKQEEQFEVVYFMDDQDSTFKLLTYKVNGKYMVVRQIPISTNEFNEINN